LLLQYFPLKKQSLKIWASIFGVAELNDDSGLLGRGQDARSPLSMVNLPVSFFPVSNSIHAQDQRRPIFMVPSATWTIV